MHVQTRVVGVVSGSSIPDLEAERARLYEELAAVPDFRRGSVSENYRRCGKANCACAGPDHRGHGPRMMWTRSVSGRRTKGRQLRAEEVEKVRAEIAAHGRFASLTAAIVEVNEAICEARPVGPPKVANPLPEGEKGGSEIRSAPSSKRRSPPN